MYIVLGKIFATIFFLAFAIIPMIKSARMKYYEDNDEPTSETIKLFKLLDTTGKLYLGEKTELIGRYILYLGLMFFISFLGVVVYPLYIAILIFIGIMVLKETAAEQRRRAEE